MSIAHINDKGEIQEVEEHNRHTAEIAEQFGKENGVGSLAYITGLMHDCGKETKAFSDYIMGQYKKTSTVRRGEINHSSAGAKYLTELLSTEEPLQRLTLQLITYAIAAHHGIFDVLNEEGEDHYRKRINPEKEIFYEEAVSNYQHYVMPEELQERFKQACIEVSELNRRIQSYIKKCNYKKPEKYRAYQFALGACQRFLLSLVIDADRIDTYDFMTHQRYQSGIHAETHWEQLQQSLEHYIETLSSEGKIALLRDQISRECLEFAKNETGIYKLTCPTGGGKTLAGFRYALEHARIKKKKHIIYVAPYRAILEQNCEVMKKALGTEEGILEHHSDVIPEDCERYQYLTDRYESPLIFTTMVQFLNTMFAKRTQSIRRFHNFADSIIIVDEVQSVPVKCVHLFNQMADFLSQTMGTTFILCTATQPALDQVKYPILLSEPREMIQNPEDKCKEFKRVDVVDARRDGGYDTEQLRELIVRTSETRSTILVIVNTKNAAKQCYESCKQYFESVGEDDITIYHLSTNMCPQHRMDVLKNMKERMANEKIICISTQLIEAGVDVSFRCVIRSFAGLDSIAQAAGRCNRHGEENNAEVLVVNYNEENLQYLEDIKEGQAATGLILDQFRSNPEIVDYDLLSLKAMEKFYQRYYFNRLEEMNYSVKKWNTSIFDMLSLNERGCSAAEEVPQYMLRQAFETAGDSFQVIDSNTFGILVPYQYGAEIIRDLNHAGWDDDIPKKLRLAQRYTVNVFSYVLKELEEKGAIYELAIGGVFALKDAFYDETTSGLQLDGQFESLFI